MNDIELNLFAYIDKIQRGSLLNLHDEKVKAEDFFLRIFEKVYGFEELINLNYEKLNSKGIDLYDSKEKIGIQITAIQSNEKTKINDTKKLTLNNWKNKGLKKLWVNSRGSRTVIRKEKG